MKLENVIINKDTTDEEIKSIKDKLDDEVKEKIKTDKDFMLNFLKIIMGNCACRVEDLVRIKKAFDSFLDVYDDASPSNLTSSVKRHSLVIKEITKYIEENLNEKDMHYFLSNMFVNYAVHDFEIELNCTDKDVVEKFSKYFQDYREHLDDCGITFTQSSFRKLSKSVDSIDERISISQKIGTNLNLFSVDEEMDNDTFNKIKNALDEIACQAILDFNDLKNKYNLSSTIERKEFAKAIKEDYQQLISALGISTLRKFLYTEQMQRLKTALKDKEVKEFDINYYNEDGRKRIAINKDTLYCGHPIEVADIIAKDNGIFCPELSVFKNDRSELPLHSSTISAETQLIEKYGFDNIPFDECLQSGEWKDYMPISDEERIGFIINTKQVKDQGIYERSIKKQKDYSIENYYNNYAPLHMALYKRISLIYNHPCDASHVNCMNSVKGTDYPVGVFLGFPIRDVQGIVIHPNKVNDIEFIAKIKKLFPNRFLCTTQGDIIESELPKNIYLNEIEKPQPIHKPPYENESNFPSCQYLLKKNSEIEIKVYGKQFVNRIITKKIVDLNAKQIAAIVFRDGFVDLLECLPESMLVDAGFLQEILNEAALLKEKEYPIFKTDFENLATREKFDALLENALAESQKE